MKRARKGGGLRSRRGATAMIAIIGLTMTAVTIGTEMDAGRMAVAKHKAQVISDAATMAASLKLPDQSEASAAAARVVNQYQQIYNTSFSAQMTWTTDGNGLTTACRCDVNENVPMLLPLLMGKSTRPTSAKAAASRVIPSRLLQGLVPIGVQYDTTFDLPANGYASPSVMTLKRGSGGDNVNPGNFGALRFPGDNSGADTWREYLKYGYTGAYQVGDEVQPKTGNMDGPTDQALLDDTDARLNRATVYPYNDDTYSNFDAGNPRIIVLPLVDWTGVHGSSDTVPIHSFAAFWVESVYKGEITGRFIRYTVTKSGSPGWEGVSVDPNSSSNFDGGLWFASMSL